MFQSADSSHFSQWLPILVRNPTFEPQEQESQQSDDE